VHYAEDREPIELGALYIAPPDRHLLVKPGEVRVVRGPKENNFRPAIDPLFRSAAYTYGRRVIGVLLSGLMDDGTHGLLQIKLQRGVTVAQSPDDAQQPDMPLSAIERVGVDHVLPAAAMAPLLSGLVKAEADSAAGPSREQPDVVEGLVSALKLAEVHEPSSPFICPDCGGPLWERKEGELLRYRCHEGHGFTAETLLGMQSAEVEQALWTSMRLLEEQAELQKRMAGRWSTSGNHPLRARFESNAQDREYAAELIRTLLTGRSPAEQWLPESPSIRREYGT